MDHLLFVAKMTLATASTDDTHFKVDGVIDQ